MPLAQGTIQKILRKLKASYPEARTALTHQGPFELLIATILSAQCTDKRVNIVTKDLFKACRHPEDFVQLGIKGLESYIKTCGLYHSKAKNIVATCQLLIDEFGGQVPKTREELITLPGVGRKTANVVLSNAFGVPAFAVDTHVLRVSNRIGLVKAKTPEATEQQLMTVVPKRQWSDAHHWLILHGRAVCHARSPNCHECSIKTWCENKSP
jgi:endonuclease III